MGEKVIPVLLREIQESQSRMWFWALHVTSIGDDPVPPENKGNKEESIEAWLDWGRKLGYMPEDRDQCLNNPEDLSQIKMQPEQESM